MIKYDYLISRDQGNEIKEYIPKDIPKSIPILAKIEGPNSSGKSTLLHLLGICFNGNKSKTINESLIGKMNSLMDSRYQELSFDIVVESNSETLRFIKKSESSNIDRIRICNGEKEYIDGDVIDRDYELVYDIPINPVKRIKELIQEMSFEQDRTVNKLKSLQIYLRGIEKEARTSKDPQQIKSLENTITELNSKLETLRETLEEKSLYKLNIQKYHYGYMYNKYLLRKNNEIFHAKKVKDQNRKVNAQKKNEYRKLNALINRYSETCEKNYGNVKRIIGEVTGIKSDISEMWERICISTIFTDGFIPIHVKTILKQVKDELLQLSSSNNKEVEQYNLMTELAVILERFEMKNFDLPTENMSVKDLLKPLKDQIQVQKNAVEQKKKIDSCISFIDEVEGDISIINSDKYKKYSNLRDEEGMIYAEEEKSETPTDIRQVVESYRKLCIEVGIDIENHEMMNQLVHRVNGDYDLKKSIEIKLDRFTFMLSEMDKTINSIEVQKEKTVGFINSKEAQLEKIRNMPESKYRANIKELSVLVKYINELISQFNVYKEFLEKLDKGVNDTSDEFQLYSRQLGVYLARKLETILHIDKQYQLQVVDMINDSFIATDGTVIRFHDMGTGQSQSAYLRSKLTASSGRKLIALFDEIAMMDSKSMLPIYEKIQDMYDNDKLLTAIVVQKGDEMLVKPIKGELCYD